MQQILFYIPLYSWFGIWMDIPIHGYGFMLFLAFTFSLALGMQLARSQKIPGETAQDLAIWLFVPGLIGARLNFVLQESFEGRDQFISQPWKIIAVWDGGLVLYGSIIGGFVGFIAAYFRLLRPKGISAWKMMDVLAPCVALGLLLGRIGCLLNGCCYGHVACPECPPATQAYNLQVPPTVRFPFSTDPRKVLVRRGLQTAAGFLVDLKTLAVTKIVPESPAALAGLQSGDIIKVVNDKKVGSYVELDQSLTEQWPRGENTLKLKVQRGKSTKTLAFSPWTIGLHPTQIYASISAGLLTFLLLSYFPLRTRDGEMMALLMLGYAIHRFLNEQIRNDTPNVAFGLTQAQTVSLFLFAGGIVMLWWLHRGRTQFAPKAALADGPRIEVPSEKEEPHDDDETALHE